MPSFTFLLTNPMLGLDAKKASEKWVLTFDAKVKPPEERFETFKIYFDGNEYDAYKMTATVFIECHPSSSEAERLSLRPPNEWSISAEERPGYMYLVTIPRRYRDSETDWPKIGIVASLPVDAFFRLHQASVIARAVELAGWLDWDGCKKQGFSLGPDPDGRDMEWRVQGKDPVLFDSLQLGTIARSKDADSEDALESAPSQEATPQEGAADTSKLVHAVNRLFWAVVIIGLLLLIKAV